MILLQDILYKVGIRSVVGQTNVPVDNIQIDSRKIEANGCFFALRGVDVDGHQFIDAAISKGATSILCEEMPALPIEGVTYVQCHDVTAAAGIVAHTFYGEPSLALNLVGVTGTNGKTTIATLLHKLYMSLGYKTGLISTVNNQIGNEVFPSTHTTPDPISLNRLLRLMVDQGCTHAFMEVSSHAIHQHRIAGLHFKGAVFSNITHDHLDYHKTFAEYIKVKKSFFDGLPESAFAISNIDDKNGQVMLQNASAHKFYYGLKSICDFKGRIIDNALDGLLMSVNEQEVHFRLIGEFNAYNLLAVFAVAMCSGEDKQQVLVALSNLTGAEGRFDYVVTKKEKLMGIVDYAHTPDALLNVLSTIKKLQHGGESVITVVGCGGDRDRSKRKLMGKAAAEFSTKAIFTSDNPRSEDPDAILREMTEGLDDVLRRKVLMIVDRREAIRTAVMMAKSEDIILVAGKGHEKYQEIKGIKFPFDDKIILNEAFKELDK
jgi:UDP-N-acetylmuramoyl-L-alanyl-D-glutamate--2,6-diaminopimelate ligase